MPRSPSPLSLAPLVASALFACSSTTNPTDGSSPSDATEASADARPDATPRAPQSHRPTAMACPADRPASNCPFPNDGGAPPMGVCFTNADCTAGTNGRCLAYGQIAQCSCSYDTCSSDSDCNTGGPCACRLSSRVGRGANTCLPGNCRTDSDCASGYCSPSLDFQCGSYSGVTGYYCRTAQDECVEDADCTGTTDAGLPTGPGFCAYSREVGRWTCSHSFCAG